MSARGKLAEYRSAAQGVLNRLRIRGKLNLLIALPMAAILLVAIPFVDAQIGNAGSASQTAALSGQTRALGNLISELQRERLVMSAYLAGVTDKESVTRQQRTVDDLAKRTQDSLDVDAPEEVTQALIRLGSLDNLRQSVLAKAATQESLARTYRATDDGLIDALRLVSSKGGDAEGTRELGALDALLRANEQGTLAGMALIIAASDQETGVPILTDSLKESQLSTARFVQEADIDQAGAVVAVEQGDEARAVQTLIDRATEKRNPSEQDSFAASAYNSVGAQSKLREDAQDTVTGQITDTSQARADSAATVAWSVGAGIALLIAFVFAGTAAVSRAIANPMRRLTRAATDVAALADTELVRVADTEVVSDQVPRLAAIEVGTADEVGELAQAFNRVQATAAMLVERQAITRRNVSMMFANVAQRTQNLVGRQLTLVDELERNEQDTRLLTSLYRLDHLSTRLRRSADNLLVVAGTRNESKLSGPMELATALRSALAEIEDYQRVQLSEVCDVTLDSEIGSDLVLVFAELLENATSYSPPETVVEVDTRYLVDGSCLVTVVDHGIGMTQERLAEENRRLVARERLDITPTTMLGLFVVGRLARRHRLTVAMVASDGGGVTVDVVIPNHAFHRNDEPQTAPQMVIPASVAQTGNGEVNGQVVFEGVAIPLAFSTNFSWFPAEAWAVPTDSGASSTEQAFSTEPAMAPPEPAVASNSLSEPSPSETTLGDRGGLRRRAPGAQLPGSSGASPPPQPPPAHTPPPARLGRHAQRDAALERGAFEGWESGLNRASEQAPDVAPAGQTSQDGRRAGLTRRIPGESMAPSLRAAQTDRPPVRVSTQWRDRDPDSDRHKLDDFTTGLSRAGSAPVLKEGDE